MALFGNGLSEKAETSPVWSTHDFSDSLYYVMGPGRWEMIT